jgi:hypothetical protein
MQLDSQRTNSYPVVALGSKSSPQHCCPPQSRLSRHETGASPVALQVDVLDVHEKVVLLMPRPSLVCVAQHVGSDELHSSVEPQTVGRMVPGGGPPPLSDPPPPPPLSKDPLASDREASRGFFASLPASLTLPPSKGNPAKRSESTPLHANAPLAIEEKMQTTTNGLRADRAIFMGFHTR